MSGQSSGAMPGMDHGAMAGMQSGSMAGMDMSGMDMGDMSMRDFSNAPEVAKNPGVQTISPMPMDRTGEPPTGLKDVGHRVLTYRDLVALERNPDVRAPRSEEHTSELQSLMRISYAVFCLKKKKHTKQRNNKSQQTTNQ